MAPSLCINVGVHTVPVQGREQGLQGLLPYIRADYKVCSAKCMWHEQKFTLTFSQYSYDIWYKISTQNVIILSEFLEIYCTTYTLNKTDILRTFVKVTMLCLRLDQQSSLNIS